VAPDGSLFVADWYDPGVGGHQVGDLEKGRIYRVAPDVSGYKITVPQLVTTADALKPWRARTWPPAIWPGKFYRSQVRLLKKASRQFLMMQQISG
jgi:hypothetical protein